MADCKCQIADLKSAEIKIESRTLPALNSNGRKSKEPGPFCMEKGLVLGY
jgi:hypothetical protein